jgi:hypothetical protein
MENVEQRVIDSKARKTGPKAENETCALHVSAKLVSLNGGVVLAVCLLLTIVTVASVMARSFVASQTALFVVLTIASWIYLIDSVSESLRLEGEQIVRTSVIGRSVIVDIGNIKSLLLKHEGLNQQVGIESLTVTYRNGKTERLPLGPCWRRRELEAFLASVESVMGYEDVVEHER